MRLLTVIWTTFGGFHVEEFTTNEFNKCKEEGEFKDVHWVENPDEFKWEQANNGMILSSPCIDPEMIKPLRC